MEVEIEIEAQERINLFMTLLQSSMKNLDITIGINMTDEKIVIMDIATQNIYQINPIDLYNKVFK